MEDKATDRQPSSGMTPSCWIILVNWNQPELTLACLRSLERTNQMGLVRVLVVDNGSTDRSVAMLREQQPQIMIMESCRNLGFTGGANLGLGYALEQGAEYVALANNDVEFNAGVIETLLSAIQTHPGVGAVCPLICDLGQDVVWALGLSVDHRSGAVTRLYAGMPVSEAKACKPFAVEAATGTMFVARRQVIEDVGLLDDSFYLYYEEVDWSIRARRAGYGIFAVPGAVVRHHVSASLQPTSPLIDYYMVRNQLLLLRKHWAFPGRTYPMARATVRALLSVAAYTVKSHRGQRALNRNARLYALRDAFTGRWGRISFDAEQACTGVDT